MTHCDRCGKESGNLFCGHCRAELMKRHSLIPLLFYDLDRKGYRVGCSVIECPSNEHGVCLTVFMNIKDIPLHEYDGDNCAKVVCG